MKTLCNRLLSPKAKMLFAMGMIAILTLCSSSLSLAYDEDSILAPLSKTTPLGFGRMLQPNVLMLLDTSGSMTYRTYSQSSTYGDGSRPYSNQYYYGRDVDSSNNDPDVAYNYHSQLTYIPDEELPFYDRAYLGGDSISGYLYPNDSRMYQLKLVLWEILEDPVMTAGLNLGMATYYQYSQWNTSDWYYYGGGYENISWEYSTYSGSKASLRVPFGSTDDVEHMDELKSWIDGYESNTNEELRANGHTPLGYSIYDSSTSDFDSAKDFFFHSSQGAITNWCQENWLIVLTDGQETGGGDPVQAVKDLYDYAENSSWTDDFGEQAQPVRTFVIGLIAPDDDDFVGLVDDLNQMADWGDDGIDNDSATAYFPTDVETLLSSFREIFSIIQVRSGTGGAPLVSPARLEGESGAVFVSTYVPKEERQWEGDLLKYTLSGDIIPDSADWSAGDQLNAINYDDRTVYTVDWQSPYADMPITGSNFASFNNDEALNLRSEVFWNPDLRTYGPTAANDGSEAPGTGATRKFVRWVLGSDEWDENVGDERWKLGDIYHSGITEVGPPLGSNPHSEYRAFMQNNLDRAKIVYIQANDGMLHAFNSETAGESVGGKERWAFIPPNVLGCGRLMGLRGYYVYKQAAHDWVFRVKEDNERVSIPRFLLDGPLVAEDVYLGGSWRTVLLNLLGYSGAGMYAIDITDPDEPDFLWAVENAIYTPDDLDIIPGGDEYHTVSYWVESGDHITRINYDHDSTIPSDLDYRQLRFTLSVPAIGSMKLSGTNHWVAVMGNGSSRQIVGDSPDGAVYVIDIENGEIIRTLTKSGMKEVVTPVTVLNTSSAQIIETFLVGDNDGHVYLWNVGNDWAGTEVFDMNASVGSSYRMDIAELNGDLWVFVITGDNDPLVANADTNYFIAFNVEGTNNFPITFDDLNKLVDDEVNSDPDGWYLEFPTDEEELATTPPLVYNGYVFFSTFKNNVDPCQVGTSRLYIVKAGTGASGWGSGSNRYIEFEGYKISGITLNDDRVFVGVTDYSGGTSENSLPDELDSLNASQQGNVLTFDVPDPVASSSFPIASGQMRSRYWREWKP